MMYAKGQKCYVKSDNYFNNDPEVGMIKDMMGEENVEPVDVFGGFVSQDKSDSNLKKTEQCIRSRFQLDPK